MSSSAAVALANVEYSTVNPRIDTMAVMCGDARPLEYQQPTPLEPSSQKITTPHAERFYAADALRVLDIVCYATAVRDEEIQKYKTHNHFRLERWMAERYERTTVTRSPSYITVLGRHTDALGRFLDSKVKFNTLVTDGQRYAYAEMDEKLDSIQAERIANRADILLEWSKSWPIPATTSSISNNPAYLGFCSNFSSLPLRCYAVVNHLDTREPWRLAARLVRNPVVIGGTPGYIDHAGAKADREHLRLLRAREAQQVDASGCALTWRGALNAYEEAGFQTGPKRERDERRVRPKKLQEARLARGTTRPETIWSEAYFDQQEQKWVLRYRATYQRPVMKQTRYMQYGLGDKITEVGTDARYNLRGFKTRRRILELVYSMIESPIGHTPEGDEITVEDYSAEDAVSSEAANSDWC